MKQVLFFLYLSSILLSAAIGIIFLKNVRNKKIFILVPYLILVFIQELGIYFYLLETPAASTSIIYNLYKIITVLVFSALYLKIPFGNRVKKILVLLLTAYLAFDFITFTLLQSLFTFSNYASTAGGLVITCYGIFFLFFYFNLDDRIQEKKWRPMILITIGLVIFYPVINIANAFDKYLLALDATIFKIELYNLIPQLMSIFMYCCFARAFYLCRKIN